MKGKTQMYVSRGRNQNNNVFLLSKKAKKDCRTGLLILVTWLYNFCTKEFRIPSDIAQYYEGKVADLPFLIAGKTLPFKAAP